MLVLASIRDLGVPKFASSPRLERAQVAVVLPNIATALSCGQPSIRINR
jgi:hypothetical protein